MGFAAHLLGDSFSHRKLKEKDWHAMYPTGRGHAASGTLPDSVLRNDPERGLALLDEYSRALISLEVDDESNAVTEFLVLTRQRGAEGEGELRRFLHDYFEMTDEALTPRRHGREACQPYLDAVFESEGFGPLRCDVVWSTFRAAAAPAFVAGGAELRDYPEVGRDPELPFVDPPQRADETDAAGSAR